MKRRVFLKRYRKQFWTMQEVCRELEAEHVAVRYWSDLFRLRVVRKKTGHRLFSRENIDDLKRIQVLTHDLGYTLEGAYRRMYGYSSSLRSASSKQSSKG